MKKRKKAENEAVASKVLGVLSSFAQNSVTKGKSIFTPSTYAGPSKDMEPIEFAQKVPVSNKFTSLNYPVYMVNFPFTLSNDTPNNIWMDVKTDKKNKKAINLEKAWAEWLEYYSTLTQFGLVYVMPSTPSNLQDLVYVANAGIALPQDIAPMTYILSNFRSTPRVCESIVTRNFMSSMGFQVVELQNYFEGAADLKYLYGNTFIGGYGLRSDIKAYEEMMDKFDMKITPIAMYDEYLYHFDCVVFPIDKDNTLVCTEVLDKKDLKKLGKLTNIIPVTFDEACNGTLNSIRLDGSVMNASLVDVFKEGTDDYYNELKRIDRLTKICDDLGLEAIFTPMNELTKSGALLSCCFDRLNYHGLDNKI